MADSSLALVNPSDGVSPLDILDGAAVLAQFIPKLRATPAAKIMKKFAVVSLGYDAIDWIGEKTNLFDLPDLEKLVSKGVDTVKGWLMAALGGTTSPQVRPTSKGYEMLRAISDGDDSKAQLLVEHARARIQQKLQDPITVIVAYFIYEVTYSEPTGMHEALEHTVIWRMLHDLPPSIYGAGMLQVSRFVSEHLEYFHGRLGVNPFAHRLSDSSDKLVHLLTAGVTAHA